MLNAKLIAFLLSLRALLMPCCPSEKLDFAAKPRAQAYARMPGLLMESSGLTWAGGGSFWTILDSGGPATLYRIDADGALLDSLPLNLPNKDWEDLARDPYGNLYIGDFGNNLNRRKDLRIYKLGLESRQVDTISFYFPEQEKFPPAKKELNYDCEAFFWYKDELHLFTKSRGDGFVRHYLVPARAGNHAASLVESAFLKGEVTAADVSPDGNLVALLTYGKVYLFALESADKVLQHALACVKVSWVGQGEALVFVSNKVLLLGNETGRLYYLQIAK